MTPVPGSAEDHLRRLTLREDVFGKAFGTITTVARDAY
jgi:hypothetical protein